MNQSVVTYWINLIVFYWELWRRTMVLLWFLCFYHIFLNSIKNVVVSELSLYFCRQNGVSPTSSYEEKMYCVWTSLQRAATLPHAAQSAPLTAGIVLLIKAGSANPARLCYRVIMHFVRDKYECVCECICVCLRLCACLHLCVSGAILYSGYQNSVVIYEGPQRVTPLETWIISHCPKSLKSSTASLYDVQVWPP